MPAGTYPILVTATVGGQQLQKELSVEITGSYSLTLSTPTPACSAPAARPAASPRSSSAITNTGTAPLTNVELTAHAADRLDGGLRSSRADREHRARCRRFVDVTARITPSGDAIAGDYNLTFRANAEEANGTASIRFTVEASILGALIGGALIVAAFAGLWWVFRRYGRR